MWQVRSETSADFGAVRDVHERAFEGRAEADLVDALRADRVHVPDLCLVALHRGSVVGHVAFSRARLDSGHPVLALAPMGVVPAYQRRGAGSALVSEALRRAAQTDYPLVVVVGHPAYYARFGFEAAAPLGIHAPFEVAAAAWMVHRLRAYSSDVRGTVVYPDAFARLT